MTISICDHCHQQGPVGTVTVTVSADGTRRWSWCADCRSLLRDGRFDRLHARKSDSVSETVVLR